MIKALLSSPLAKDNSFNQVANIAMEPNILRTKLLGFMRCAVAIMSITETIMGRVYAAKSM